MAHHVAKFCEVPYSNLNVTAANTLNFKPIDPFCKKKLLSGPTSLLQCALANLGHSLVRAKFTGCNTSSG